MLEMEFPTKTVTLAEGEHDLGDGATAGRWVDPWASASVDSMRGARLDLAGWPNETPKTLDEVDAGAAAAIEALEALS